jgi:hypothetical protein
LRTRLTVASLTPACFATSASLRATLQLYDKSVQVLPSPDVASHPRVSRVEHLRLRRSSLKLRHSIFFILGIATITRCDVSAGPSVSNHRRGMIRSSFRSPLAIPRGT